MPANRIQPRTWFVELRLSAAVSARDTPFESSSDADVRSCIKDILERSNYSRTIRGLQHVSFAYSVRDPTQLDLAGNQVQSIVDVIGFAHCNESILDTTMHSWIQDWRVMDQRWTPVYVTRDPALAATGYKRMSSRISSLIAIAASASAWIGCGPATPLDQSAREGDRNGRAEDTTRARHLSRRLRCRQQIFRRRRQRQCRYRWHRGHRR